MKKTFILAMLALPLLSQAQRKEVTFGAENNKAGHHRHDGFYLSMAAGVFFDNITDKATLYSTYYFYPTQHIDATFKGSGGQFDFKIGAAVAENFILHATLVSSGIIEPDATINGKAYSTTSDFTIDQSLLGIGVTYYLMPSNFFGSASFGLGRFAIDDGKSSRVTDRGFGMQLKAGKEWWIGRNWGLGIGLTYGKTVVSNIDGPDTEKINSNSFGILLNTTFN